METTYCLLVLIVCIYLSLQESWWTEQGSTSKCFWSAVLLLPHPACTSWCRFTCWAKGTRSRQHRGSHWLCQTRTYPLSVSTAVCQQMASKPNLKITMQSKNSCQVSTLCEYFVYRPYHRIGPVLK